MSTADKQWTFATVWRNFMAAAYIGLQSDINSGKSESGQCAGHSGLNKVNNIA